MSGCQRMFVKFLFLVFCCFNYYNDVSGSCEISPPIVETLRTGKQRYMCEFESVRMDVGSQFVSMSCQRCECTKDGLSCCGIGYKAGARQVPPGCEIIGDACEPISVKSCDNSLSCDTGKPIYRNYFPPPGYKMLK